MGHRNDVAAGPLVLIGEFLSSPDDLRSIDKY